MGGQVGFAAKRTLQSAINQDGSQILVPVRLVVDRRRSDQFRDWFSKSQSVIRPNAACRSILGTR